MLKMAMGIQRWCFLFLMIFFAGQYSCKKDSNKPTPVVTIVGKWLPVKLTSSLFSNGVKVDSVEKAKFTNDDFVEYYSDGSGYYSKSSPVGPSLSEFTYKIAGTTLIQYYNVENDGVPETITNLTANSLTIHIVSKVYDPNHPNATDTEIDDFSYTR